MLRIAYLLPAALGLACSIYDQAPVELTLGDAGRDTSAGTGGSAYDGGDQPVETEANAGGSATGGSAGSAVETREAGDEVGGSAGTASSVDAGTIPDAALLPDAKPLNEELIDDMTDNAVPHTILTEHGRVGYWFTVSDGADGGVQSPAAGPFGLSPDTTNGGAYSAHLAGHGFNVWGIYMGFTLNKTLQGARNLYDGRAYTGISFWAKRGATDMCSVSSSCRLVHIAISNRDTDSQGGVCTTACSDHFGFWVDGLTTEWTKHTILFSQFTQDGWGIPGPAQGLKLDASGLLEVQFQVKPAATPFDVWVDKIAFVYP
jgi:hypothetical protein